MQRFRSLILLAGLLLPRLATAAPSYEPIAAFEIGPITPGRAKLLRHSDGAFYGVSTAEYFPAAIYRILPSGQISTVAHFPPEIGGLTYSGLVDDARGYLWGTVFSGGTVGYGAIYKVDPASGVVLAVIDFKPDELANKGRFPFAGLVADGTGFLWGTTNQGGVANIGTVFKINAVTGALTTIAQFTGSTGAAPGAYPRAAMVSDGAGYLWGVTTQGGSADAGTIFKVNAATDAFAIVVELDGTHGYGPEAEFTADGLGYLWSTTRFNGANFYGTVFKVRIATGEVTTVVDFTGPSGAVPGGETSAGLVRDAGGFMWGTTPTGGSADGGTLFKINASTGEFTSVRQFTTELAADRGHSPRATLMDDGAGRLWGTTFRGGTRDRGTVFRVDPADGSFATVAQFTGAADAVSPFSPLGGVTSDATGGLWGTTYEGGPEGLGTIYRLDPTTGAVSVVRSFTGFAGATPGSFPEAKLYNDGAGWFWGTTISGGAADFGTVFKVNMTTGEFVSVAEFAGPDAGSAPNRGGYPQAGLIGDGAGYLWGTTAAHGTGTRGTVFKLNAATGALSTVIDFAGPNGSQPVASLCLDGAGFLWGTTLFGGDSNPLRGGGTVFKIHLGTEVLTTVARFTEAEIAAKGWAPHAGLAADGTGNLWGTTSGGGPNSQGTVFKVNIASGAFTSVLSFTYPNGARPGSQPYAGLVRDDAGSFWGTTAEGSSLGLGTIFKVSDTGAFTHAFTFTGSAPPVPGAYPGSGYLHRHTDGHLYGVAGSGGFTRRGAPAAGGQIFRIRLTGAAPPLEAWKQAHLGHPLAPDDGDPDRDGLSTLSEYGLLLLPGTPDAGTLPPVSRHAYPDGARLRMLVRRDPARSDVTLRVEAAGDLAGPWQTIATSTLGAPFSGLGYVGGDSATPGVKTVEVRDVVRVAEAPRRFLRVAVVR